MKKYKIFRLLGDKEDDIETGELIAVEYGQDVYDAADKLIKTVCDDALGLEKFQKGFTAFAYAPVPIDGGSEPQDYYYLTAILAPEYGEKNDLVEYGIIEEESPS